MVVETKKIMHAPEHRGGRDVRARAGPALPLGSGERRVRRAGRPRRGARSALEAAPGITVLDDPATKTYPMPALLEGTDDTYVGRLRVDPTVRYGLSMWVVADQLRKGAALNAVQIAEELASLTPNARAEILGSNGESTWEAVG